MKSVVESDRKANPSKFLWLSLLHTRMKKIHSKMKCELGKITVIWISLLALSKTLALYSSLSSSTQTVHKFFQLLDLLLDEKHSQIHTEYPFQDHRIDILK